MNLTPRLFYLALTLICATLLGFGYYLQFAQGLEPCPLCIFQRIAYIAVSVIAIAGLIHGPRKTGIYIYNSLISISALIGGGIAGWQVYLQHLPPDQVPECGPGLDYMLDMLPIMDVIKTAFTGSGECAEVSWTFLTFSIPEWSLLCFSLIVLASITYAIKSRR